MAIRSGPWTLAEDTNARLCFDSMNPRSYSGSGIQWTDVIRNISYSDTVNGSAGSETWMGGASSGITIQAVIEKKGTVVGYAEHPINKWSTTSDASFVLYHFGTTGGPDGLAWYGNNNGTWGAISQLFYATNGTTILVTLQYSDSTGGQMWKNSTKIGGRSGGGVRGTNSTSLKIFGPVGTSTIAVKCCYMWDRELTDAEILRNYEAFRDRYSL